MYYAQCPAPSTTAPGLVRGWPADGTSEEWYKCNNCGWLPSSVGGVVQTMPRNDLGLTWHEACAWWCDQEPECVTAWHRKSGNHCSLYNFALPFDANDHPSSHFYVKPTPAAYNYVLLASGERCDESERIFGQECVEAVASLVDSPNRMWTGSDGDDY